jgi:hypothetical protein
MTDKLTEFLTNLSTDKKLVNDFKKDKKATMKAHGVPTEHIELVVNSNYDGVRKVLGADYDIASNGVIKAFKIK